MDKWTATDLKVTSYCLIHVTMQLLQKHQIETTLSALNILVQQLSLTVLYPLHTDHYNIVAEPFTRGSRV